MVQWCDGVMMEGDDSLSVLSFISVKSFSVWTSNDLDTNKELQFTAEQRAEEVSEQHTECSELGHSSRLVLHHHHLHQASVSEPLTQADSHLHLHHI